MKKILFLGSSYFQIPAIKYALNAGYKVLTSDNMKENPGHKLSHKSFNVSTLNREKILKIAEKEKIDGILSSGSDLSMLTCSYVANQLKLPCNSPKSVKRLVYKSNFRQFLKQNNIQQSDYNVFDFSNMGEIKNFLKTKKSKYIVKPIDSNGSKGISIIYPSENFKSKVIKAYNASFRKKIIIEKYLHKQSPQICGDGYFQNDKVVFIYFGDGYYYNNENFMAPWGETFPSSHGKKILGKAKKKIESILRLSGFKRGPFNFDLIITKDNDVFIIEIGPRSGGNFIPTIIKKQTGVDMIKAEVEACLDKDYYFNVKPKKINKFFGSYMLHSKTYQGKFKNISFSKDITKFIENITIYKKQGQLIEPFSSGNMAIGNVIIKTETIREMRSLFQGQLHKNFKIHMFK